MEVSLLKVLKLVTKIYIILEFWEIPLTKEKIKLSIITPTYNNGALLQRLYNSIKSQKLKELIWIIVDDGSSDNTRSIVDKFYDKRIIYKKQKNKGPNSARNFGEKFIPRGCKYVIFIDSDDTFYDHNSLEMMYEEIKNSSKKINESLYELDLKGLKGYLFTSEDFYSISHLISKSSQFISCHGAFTHIASNYKIKILDVIEKNKIIHYGKITNSMKNYKSLYRDNFETLSKDIIKYS